MAAASRTPAGSSGGWPGVTWREAEWMPDPGVQLSRTQRVRNRGAFTFAEPARIAEAPVVLDPAVQESARAATGVIERFDERAVAWGNPFASVLLRSESASSSEIERLSASARRIALATLGDGRSENATRIARNVRAMQAAVALSDHMDAEAILAMHRELGGGDDPENAGRFRTEWVWIRGRSPVTAEFVATHHSKVETAIDDLVRFLRRTDIEPLTQAAIAHAQFETIHPFTDGNGRTGRALVSSVLRYRGAATNLSVPISSGLLSDASAYFDALTAYREGDLHPIVDQFAVAAERAVVNATILHDDVSAIRDDIVRTAVRRTRNIERFAELCASEPAFNINMVVEWGIARPTAYRLCERLTSLKMLRRERSIGGVDVWTVVGLTDALDAFAARSGRRSFGG